VADKPETPAGELPPAPEPVEEIVTPEVVAQEAIAEPEGDLSEPADTSGDFREPHPEEPAEAALAEQMSPVSSEPGAEAIPEAAHEPAPEAPPAHEHEHRPAPEPARQRPPARPIQPEYRRPEPRSWAKPPDFRPAEVSAISQAVAHATEIAESLKHTIDQLDEILELVELAERQKLADEREIDELRRALRRIQPPRYQPPPPRGPRRDEPRREEPRRDEPRRDEPHRGYREHGPRPEESRQARQESQESDMRPEEPRPPEAGEPPAHID
jgi:hypothetical protein